MTSSQKLYEDLYSQITNKELLPGMAIPSENELANTYSISRPTVRKILDKLCKINFLEKKAGKGTFVRNYIDEVKSSLDEDFVLGIDILASTTSSYYYGNIINTIKKSKYGKNCYFNLQKSEDLEKGILNGRVDGLLLIGKTLPADAYEKLLKYNIPIILLNRISDIPGIAYLSIAHHDEAERCIEYLLRYNHDKIAFMGLTRSTGYTNMQRFSGWKDAFIKMGKNPPEELVFCADEMEEKKIAEKMSSFVDENDFSAVFFMNFSSYQILNPMLTQSLHKKNKNVYSIVFDDISFENQWEQNIGGYVIMPLEKMSINAIEYLRNKLANPKHEVLKAIYDCSIITKKQ